MADRRVSGRLLSGAVGVLLGVQPVAAQSGVEIARQMTCQTRIAPMLTAVWIFGVLILSGYGIFRAINGLKKTASPNPQKKKEGRGEAAGSLYVFVGIVILLAAPKILTFMGISVFDCLQFTLP